MCRLWKRGLHPGLLPGKTKIWSRWPVLWILFSSGQYWPFWWIPIIHGDVYGQTTCLPYFSKNILYKKPLPNHTIMSDIEKRINIIEERNERVELDKAWETSFSKKIIITVLTYITIVLFLIVAKLPKPFINSIVPTTGFVLSTLSLPFFKKLWIKYRAKK